jgi:hypothetical protein
MDQKISSAINRELYHLKAPEHITIMNANRNAKRVITALTHPNVIAEMALQYSVIIITAVGPVNNRVVDFEETESWASLNIHTIHLIRSTGEGTECLQKMQHEFEARNEGTVIPTEVRLQVRPRSIWERRQNADIASS